MVIVVYGLKLSFSFYVCYSFSFKVNLVFILYFYMGFICSPPSNHVWDESIVESCLYYGRDVEKWRESCESKNDRVYVNEASM